METEFVVMFEMMYPKGTLLQLGMPSGYKMRCNDASMVNQMSLPGAAPKCLRESPSMLLRINDTLKTGYYAFSVRGVVPTDTPVHNTFSVNVSNDMGVVLNGAYGLAGMTIRRMRVVVPTIAWTDSMPNVHTEITLGVTVEEAVSNVRSIVIQFPQGFRHDITNPAYITSLNKVPGFPMAAANEWAIYDNVNRLQLFLDDSEATTTIRPATYRFRFPVIVPRITEFPQVNVWIFTLCGSKLCTSWTDQDAVLVFPIPGFDLRQRHHSSITLHSTSAAAHLGVFGLLVALFFSWP